MTLGMADKQGNLFDDVARFCSEALPERSIYSFLARERDRLFPDEAFADLFDEKKGRRSVPPSVVATVMVLQRLEGLSDREAVERYCFDNRWRYAAGVGGYDANGWTSFAHTVLVDMRERLRRSERPDRIFEAALGAARDAGLVGRKRALDSTPLYDAVATMDTITLIRSAIRGLLKAADPALEDELRRAMTSGDDYASAAKPQIDWDDKAARADLVDQRAKDAYACLAYLDGSELAPSVEEAARLLATVVGQDLEEGSDGIFRIARKVAKDRVISTVDPETHHGHKTQARGFDGYKGHVAVDPDSEIITATTVTPGNASDGSVAEDLIAELLEGALQRSTTLPRERHPMARWSTPRKRPTKLRATSTHPRPSTGTTRMAPGTSRAASKTRGSTRGARPRSPTPPMACSEKIDSPSTSKKTRSPAPPASRSPSGVTATVVGSPSSQTPVHRARCGRSARRPRRVAASLSVRTKQCSPGRAPARSTPTGSLITGPPDRRSSARSRISCDANTAVVGPGCAAESGSPPTSSSSPPPSIWHASECSACAQYPAGGTSLGHEEPRIVAGSGRPTPPGATRAAK